MASRGSFKFAIDRGGTFTDVFAECPDNSVRVMKLLSVDPKYEEKQKKMIKLVKRNQVKLKIRIKINKRIKTTNNQISES